MSSLPVLLKNPRILLLGGGKVAFQKAKVLKENQVRFEVLAKDVEVADLDPYNIIVDATGDTGVKDMLCRERVARFLFLNIVDDPELSDFYFSSLLNYGRLKIAVSTDGASPSLGQSVRDHIKRVIPEDLSSLVEKKSLERARGVIDAAATKKEVQRCLAQVDLVGCGPGDVTLLTLQACRCIEEADVVLYDHLISEGILSLVPERAEKIYVGKQKQAHSLKQDEINEIILQQALRGFRIARLKSGDPYIFGRGAEEAEFLARHGVRVQVIPGISSAVAGPSAAGIPLTARGYATNVSIVSAHLAGSRFNADWLPLLQIRNHTTVVLMGLSFAIEIAQEALLNGTPPDMPVAIISNATLASQKVITTTLDKLAEKCRHAVRPAVLVFGDVVKLNSILPHLNNGCGADQ
jgi:uroporphyrin-III C-methyltransferase/precorrin-2 dehydrogenase/sirohydrochlorin ferrochelatase